MVKDLTIVEIYNPCDSAHSLVFKELSHGCVLKIRDSIIEMDSVKEV